MCGDGVIDLSEICDDNNMANSDGCSSSCRVESGYACSASPSICTLMSRIYALYDINSVRGADSAEPGDTITGHWSSQYAPAGASVTATLRRATDGGILAEESSSPLTGSTEPYIIPTGAACYSSLGGNDYLVVYLKFDLVYPGGIAATDQTNEFTIWCT
mgnify:FL=1